MTRKVVFLLLIVGTIGTALYGSSVWEGNASMSRFGEFPNKGYYAASNSFERNTIIEVENLENGKKTTVIVADRLEAGGLFLLLSREAAEDLGIQQDELARVRVSIARSEGTDIVVVADDRPYNDDPDINPAAALEEYEETAGEGIEQATEVADVGETAEELPEDAAAEELRPNAAEGESPVLEETAVVPRGAEGPVEPEPVVEGPREPKLEEESPGEEERVAEGPNADAGPPVPVVTELSEGPDESFEISDRIEVIIEVPEVEEEPEEEEEVLIGASDLQETPETGEFLLSPRDIPEEPEQYGDRPGPEVRAKPEVDELPEKPGPGPEVTADIAALREPDVPEEEKPEIDAVGPSPEEEEIIIVAADIPSGPEPIEEEVVTPEPVRPTEEPVGPEPEETGEAPATEPGPLPEDAEIVLLPAGPKPPEKVPSEEGGPAVSEEEIPEPKEPIKEPSRESSKEPSKEPEPKEPAEPEEPAKIAEAGKPIEDDTIERFRTTGSLLKDSYYVQLGAFSEPGGVSFLLEDFTSNYPVTVYKSNVPAETKYRVLVGPLNLDESGSVLFTVRSKGFGDAFIRKGE